MDIERYKSCSGRHGRLFGTGAGRSKITMGR